MAGHGCANWSKNPARFSHWSGYVVNNSSNWSMISTCGAMPSVSVAADRPAWVLRVRPSFAAQEASQRRANKIGQRVFPAGRGCASFSVSFGLKLWIRWYT